MPVHAPPRELEMRNGDVVLAGSLWLPAAAPAAAALMHPGSGPSDRDNDVFFPPIRRHLLDAGIAVASFDKRGVGGSTGRWEDAAIEEQADDALAALAGIRDELPGIRTGLFGHSQGGWVVVEVASRSADVAFVVASSGPGVTPVEQERYSHRMHLLREGVRPEELDDALEPFELVANGLAGRLTFEEMKALMERAPLPTAYDRLELILFPDDAAVWGLMLNLYDYDPRPALERVRVPVLALFGGDDRIVPVEASVSVYREAVRPELLTVAVFAGADHRVQAGDPLTMVDGYLQTLTDFVLQAVA